MAKQSNKNKGGKRQNSKFDVVCKNILERSLPALLQHLLPEAGEVVSVLPQPTDLPHIAAKYLDLLFIVSFTHKNYLVHIEVQSHNHPKMHLRMHGYAHSAALRYYDTIEDLELLQIVFYVGKPKLNMLNSWQWGNLHYAYHLIDVRTVPPHIFEALNTLPGWIFAFLSREENSEQHVDHILSQAFNYPNQGQTQEDLELFFTLLDLRPEYIALAMKRLVEYQDPRKSTVGRFFYEVVLKKYQEEGLEKARQEVLAEAEKIRQEVLAEAEKIRQESLAEAEKIRQQSLAEAKVANNLKIAQNMHAEGIPLAVIARVTGLSESSLTQLLSQQ